MQKKNLPDNHNLLWCNAANFPIIVLNPNAPHKLIIKIKFFFVFFNLNKLVHS